MHAGETPHADVREEPGQDARLHGLLIVGEVAVGVEDGEPTRAEQLTVEAVCLELSYQRGDPGRALLHLGGCGRRRWPDLDTRFDLLTDEDLHKLRSIEAAELRLQEREERTLLVRELPRYPRRLEQAEAVYALRAGRGVSERDEAPSRVSDQMEACESSGVGEAIDRLELLIDGVVGRRRRPAIHLELLEVQVRQIADCLDQRSVPLGGRSDASGKADDLRRPHTGALLRISSSAWSTRLASAPRTRITSSLVSKFGYEPTDTSGYVSSSSRIRGQKSASTAKVDRS